MGWFGKRKSEWKREAGEVAVRIAAEDVKRAGLNRPFVVYDGTMALVFSSGQLLGRLPAGSHDIDGPLRNWLVGDAPTVLILTDAGDITLDHAVGELHSTEGVQLSASLRLTMRLNSPERFYQNVMKGRRSFLEADLLEALRPDLRDALLAITSRRSIDELSRNPSLRGEAETALRGRIGDNLQRMGFELVALRVVEFASDAFDGVRARAGDVAIESRDADVDEARREVLQRARENLAEEIRHKQITRAELQDAIQQSVHELGVKDRLREDEITRLNERLDQDAADYEQQRLQQRESDRREHELGEDAARREHGREQETLDVAAFLDRRIREAETGERVRDAERRGDEQDWELASRMRDSALDARRRKHMDDVDVERARIEALSKADAATKLALLGDSEAILELERLDRQSNLSEEQLLVLAAEKSDAVAAALAKRFEAEGRMNEELVDQLRRQLDQERQGDREHAAQLERVLNQALEHMGRVAGAKAAKPKPGDQTIVTGGMGTPTVIDPSTSKDDEDEEPEKA